MAMTLRLSDDDNAKLREVADREGKSMQEVVVVALRHYFDKHEEFRAHHVRRFLDEDSELLELLSR